MARKSRKNLVQERMANASVGQISGAPLKRKLATAAYCRLSVENGGRENEDSLDTQEKLIRDFIDSHPDLEWKGSYKDNGFTGTNFDRPAFNRLMEDVRAGQIQCIVVKDLSRFGRDYLETGHYLETIFPKLNVRFIAVTDNFDNTRKEDMESLSVPVRNLVNAIYAKNISKKVSSANDARILRGEIMGNFAPYGYLIDEKKSCYVPDEDTAHIVRVIYFWFLHGQNKYEISRRLNFLGIPAPRERQRIISDGRHFDDGKEYLWQQSSVMKILTNPVYIGDLATGRTKRALYKGVKYEKRDREDWYVTENAHEPIITRADFEKVREIMNSNKRTWEEGRKNHEDEREGMPAYFSKLIYCRHCGGMLTIDRKSHGDDEASYGVYLCANRRGNKDCGHAVIHESYLLMLVVDQIKAMIALSSDRKTLAEAVVSDDGADEKIDSLNKSMGSTRYQLSQVNEKKGKLYEDLAEGILNQEDYQLMKEHYILKEQQLQKKLQETELLLYKIKTQAKQYLDRVQSLEKYLGEKEISRKLIQELIDRIIVGDSKNIEIVFKGEDIYQDFLNTYEEANVIDCEEDGDLSETVTV